MMEGMTWLPEEKQSRPRAHTASAKALGWEHAGLLETRQGEEGRLGGGVGSESRDAAESRESSVDTGALQAILRIWTSTMR